MQWFLTFANAPKPWGVFQAFVETILPNNHAFSHVSHDQGRRNVDWAWGAVKKLGAMEIYEKQKICYQLCLLLFKNDLKNNEGNCRKFVSIRSWYTIKFRWYCSDKDAFAPVVPLLKGQGTMSPLSGVPAYRYQKSVPKQYLPRCLRSTVTCGRGKTPNIATWNEH